MRVAVAQLCSGIDPAANARLLGRLIDEAADGGAAMLFTPEMTNIVDRDRKRAATRIVGEADDPVLAAAREGARRSGLWLHIGSLAVRSEVDPARYANRGFVIGPDGEIAARYDKMHLFDVDLVDGTSWRESASYRAGDGAVVVDGPGIRLGLSICYDLRFPALFDTLGRAGAELLAVPAAFTVPTGEAHWQVLLRARAIEGAAFVVAAAQAGWHADGRSTYGHSLVVDPWGRVLLDMGLSTGLGFCDLDLARLAEVRAQLPALEHRRPVSMV